MSSKVPYKSVAPEAFVSGVSSAIKVHDIPTGAIELSFYDYICNSPEECTVDWEVVNATRTIGRFMLGYNYSRRVMMIEYVHLNVRNQGIGSALYRAALNLPLPSGELPREQGFILESRYGSDSAVRCWEGLVRTGEAEKGDKTDRHYIMR